jgi:orotidine-5'-phosphate decarboxylase
MTFYEKLQVAWSTNNSLLCVGLDPDIQKLPLSVKNAAKPIYEFNKAIIDATADTVCAYKPQIAYYAAYGAEDQLSMTIEYMRKRCPGVVVILDAKRGDIGSTAEMYAAEAFDRYGADAVTVNPYMGGDTLEPFLKRGDKGVIILCRTSNPGAADIQDLTDHGEKVYVKVARMAAGKWNERGNVALVVGATYPRELGEIRGIAPEIPLLVPGVGAQGGDVEAVLKNGRNAGGTGLIINSSRAILYASMAADFAAASRAAAIATRDEINKYR